MNVTVENTEQMISDIDNLEEELRQNYIKDNKPVPPAHTLREQAQCAWVYMTVRGVLHQAQQVASAQIQEARQRRAAAPTIIAPSGRRLV